MDQDNEFAGLRTFFERSNHNLVQVGGPVGTTINLTYPRGDHAAERAGWMARRMAGGGCRHVQKARLRDGMRGVTEIILITDFPGVAQKVVDIETLSDIRVPKLLIDESLAAFQTAVAMERK